VQLGDHYFKLKEFLGLSFNTYLAAQMDTFVIPDSFKKYSNLIFNFLALKKVVKSFRKNVIKMTLLKIKF
jgi:hypothetical protein